MNGHYSYVTVYEQGKIVTNLDDYEKIHIKKKEYSIKYFKRPEDNFKWFELR
jgi:hypothetical protein